MNSLVSIEKVVKWDQRNEPTRGAHVIQHTEESGALLGWYEPVGDSWDQTYYLIDHKSGVYLGDNLVACLAVKARELSKNHGEAPAEAFGTDLLYDKDAYEMDKRLGDG